MMSIIELKQRRNEMATQILKCECKHDYQDKRYGCGMRVHNALAPAKGSQQWRCTVCEKVRSGPDVKDN